MKTLIKKHEQKIRYLVIGAWNTLFGFIAFVGLYKIGSKVVHYTIILIFVYVLTITQNYVTYKFFVFRTRGDYLKEYYRFYIVYGFSFVINMSMLPLLVEIIKINPIIAQGIIALAIITISYLGHKNFSFKE